MLAVRKPTTFGKPWLNTKSVIDGSRSVEMSARTWFQRAQGSAMSYLQEKINSLSSASAKYERYQKYAGNPLRTLAKVSKNKGKNRSTGKTAAAVVGATTGVSVAGLLAAPLAVPAAG